MEILESDGLRTVVRKELGLSQASARCACTRRRYGVRCFEEDALGRPRDDSEAEQGLAGKQRRRPPRELPRWVRRSCRVWRSKTPCRTCTCLLKRSQTLCRCHCVRRRGRALGCGRQPAAHGRHHGHGPETRCARTHSAPLRNRRRWPVRPGREAPGPAAPAAGVERFSQDIQVSTRRITLFPV